MSIYEKRILTKHEGVWKILDKIPFADWRKLLRVEGIFWEQVTRCQQTQR